MTTKYKVKSTLHHNGAVYQEGSEIELSDIYAQPLLAVDVIEPIPVVVEPVSPKLPLDEKPLKDMVGPTDPVPPVTGAEEPVKEPIAPEPPKKGKK